MTTDPQHTSEGRPPGSAAPAPGATSRLVDLWDDTWRGPVAGGVVGVLTLPAVALALVGLVVLALEGEAEWLLVVAAALVTTALGAVGAAVGLRRGHPGVVHRLAVMTVVWGVLVIVAGVVVALTLDGPSRGSVAVLLVLGGAYTVVLGLGLWGAARVMPVPERADGGDLRPDGGRSHDTRSGDTRPDDTRPHDTRPHDTRPHDTRTTAGDPARSAPHGTPAAGDDELAEWPEWGGDPTHPGAPGAGAAGHDPAHGGPQAGARTATGASSLPGRPAAPAPGRSTGPTPARSTGRTASSAPAPGRSTPPVRPRHEYEEVVDAVVVEETAEPSTPPQRRSVTSAGGAGVRRTPQPPGPATERIERQGGEDGPPTQRIPPVG